MSTALALGASPADPVVPSWPLLFLLLGLNIYITGWIAGAFFHTSERQPSHTIELPFGLRVRINDP